MPAKLYPLVFKAGVKRDGTPFQADYCTDAQWIRWSQSGRVRKMLGMYALDGKEFDPITIGKIGNSNIPIIYLLQTKENKIVGYVATSNKVYSFTASNTNDTFTLEGDINLITGNVAPTKDTLPVIIRVKTSNGDRVLFYFGANANDIFNDVNGTLWLSDPSNAKGLLVEQAITYPAKNNANYGTVNGLFSGGICYNEPYLFLYGTNNTKGNVLCSAANNLFDFTNPNGETKEGGGTNGVLLSVSSDKVIFGAAIRGGLTQPTMLFWSISSVVKISNNATDGSLTGFKVDVISNNTSILSSRCVVEYDGLFYWPGTNSFFVYNGTVVPLPNQLNINYFFANLNFAQRQAVYGFTNMQFGEIWWCYPHGQNVTRCNRAIIYNVLQQTWYDTAIPRDCAFNLNSNGKIYSFGTALTQIGVQNPIIANYVFQHETGVTENYIAPNAIEKVRTEAPITSYFTTPTFSWASFSPLKENDGIDRWMTIDRIEPDILMNEAENGIVSIITNTKKYAQSPLISYTPVTFNRVTEAVFQRASGRQISFTISSTAFFEMGNWFMLLDVGAGR